MLFGSWVLFSSESVEEGTGDASALERLGISGVEESSAE